MTCPRWIRKVCRAVASCLCFGKVDIDVASASPPETAPVQGNPCPLPRLDYRPATTQAPPSGVGTTTRKRQGSSSRLSNSLYGHSLATFVGTSDYRHSAGSSQDNSLKPMNSSEDIARMFDLIQSFPGVPEHNLRYALNQEFTKSNVVKYLTELRPLPGPRLYYLGGHAEWCGERGEFDYLFNHDIKNSKVNDPPQSISSTELSGLLVDQASPIPIQMILITDFCHSFNLLRLPWALRRTTDGTYLWEKSEHYVPGARANGHRILQFASGEKGAATYSFKHGSIFTR
ncbi:hypothetical protein FRC08_016881, partial [Ceratobasidium sp. 394]